MKIKKYGSDFDKIREKIKKNEFWTKFLTFFLRIKTLKIRLKTEKGTAYNIGFAIAGLKFFNSRLVLLKKVVF